MQAKNEEWQMVCANVFGLEWSQRLRAMMEIRSLSSFKVDSLLRTFSEIRFRKRGINPCAISIFRQQMSLERFTSGGHVVLSFSDISVKG